MSHHVAPGTHPNSYHMCCKNQFEWQCISQVTDYLGGLGMAAEQEEIAVVGLGSEDYGGVIDHSFSQQLLAKHEGLMKLS